MKQLLVKTDPHEGPVYVAAERALYFTTAGCSSASNSLRRSAASTLRRASA